MNHISYDEIRGVLVPTGEERILLPNATVAEVMSRVQIESFADTSPWLLGQIQWYGWRVPLVSLARFSQLGDETLGQNNKAIVLKSLGGREDFPYWGLLTSAFPQLVSVPRDGLLADASEDALPIGVHMRVLLGDQHVLIPDLDAIELAIQDALAKRSES